MASLSRNTIPPHVYRTHFMEVLQKYAEQTQLYTDAFKSSNKCACAVTTESTVLIRYSLPTYYSILSAELWAIKLAID